MTTITVQMAGTTSPDNWELVAGASKQAAVNQPDDDTTSYIRSGTTIDTHQTFTCSPALVAGDTITAITIYARCRRGGASDANFRVGYAFTPSGGGSQTAESAGLTGTTNFADFNFSATGLSAVWGSGLTFWIRNTQARQVHCTTLYAEIVYTPAPTGDGQPTVARTRNVPGMGRAHGWQGW